MSPLPRLTVPFRIPAVLSLTQGLRDAWPKSGSVLFPALTIAIGLSGCGNSDAPPLAKVTGTVSYQGKPLTSGVIQFIPDREQGTTGRMAIGAIQSNGTYELRTVTPGDGAQVGHHLVVIQAFETLPPTMAAEPPVPKALIPLKYTEPGSTDLKAEVKANMGNQISFDLK